MLRRRAKPKIGLLCVFYREENMNLAVKLLAAAGGLMALAGGIFALLHMWLYAALIWEGAFGCFMGAFAFKNRYK